VIILPFAEPAAIARLESIKRSNPAKADEAEKKLKLFRAGAKAEKDAAYQIDFQLKDSQNYAVLHGLRVEFNGRVCQVDHLIIDRFLTFYTIETKSFHAGFKVTDEGQFLRWNNYQKRYENMPSPFLQSERHQVVLRDLLERQGWLPKRLGFQIKPRFEAIMVVDPKVRVIRPETKVFDTSKIVTYEAFFKAMRSKDDLFGDIASLARAVSQDTLLDIATKLASMHAPLESDFSYLEAMTAPQQEGEASGQRGPVSPDASSPDHTCKHCSSTALEMLHGKFGYYFKCKDCGGNTPPSLPGKGRLRKDGKRFYFVPDGGADELVFFDDP
jgi:Nuclease-related domain.